MNDEMKNRLETVYNLILSMKEMDDMEANVVFQENLEELVLLYYDFTVYCRAWQREDLTDSIQAELSKKFFEVVKWTIENREFFEKTEYYDYVPDAILRQYADAENYRAYEISITGSLDEFYNLENYLSRKQELEKIINGKKEKSSAESGYINSHDEYMKLYYGHALIFLEKFFTQIPEKEIFKFISEVENSGYVEETVLSDDKKLRFDSSNLVFQYFMFATKTKSKFKPHEIVDDKIVQYLWNGKIKNKKVIDFLLGDDEKEARKKSDGVSIGDILDIEYIFTELLKREGFDGHFFLGLNEHFTNVGLPKEYIYEIIKNIIPKCSDYSSLEFLADLGIPKDCSDYIIGEEYLDVPFVKRNPYIVELLKKAEEKALRGKCMDIPYNYALKKMPKLTKHAIENIYTMIKAGGYEPDEAERLEKLLIENGYLEESRLTNEEIEFQEDMPTQELVEKSREAFYNRQIIPYEVAIKLIKANYNENLHLDEESFKACLSSIIHNELKEYGIDIGNHIFFGEDKFTRGVNISGEFKAIWINNGLVRNFINISADKSDGKNHSLKNRVWITAFHEMKHAKQCANIENGNIDFLTYNFIKEEVIRNNDSNFYDSNYIKMFIEEDARQYGIIDAMRFLKGLGIKDFDTIFPEYRKELAQELSDGNINKDSEKNLAFRGNTKINNTEYVSRIIRNNPAILEKYGGILKIEFNDDGSTKDVLTMLKEYDERKAQIEKEEGAEYKLRNLYSIYYGIIRQRTFEGVEFAKEEQAAIMEFSRLSDALVSIEDLRYYASKTEPEIVDGVLKSFKEDLDSIGTRVGKERNGNGDKSTPDVTPKKTVIRDMGDGEYGED